MKFIQIKRVVGIFIIGILFIHSTWAQGNLPILKTNTKTLDVREGHNFYKGYWGVSPEVKKDVYFAHRFKKTTTITFYSDVDSISFRVSPRNTYDFIILLNNKDTCYTQISTIRTSYFKECHDCIISKDTIPFTLGNDNRIYVAAKVNDSETIKLFFDTGADNIVLFPSAYQKGVKLKFDGSIANRATGGTEIRKTSNLNDLAICKLKWKDEQVMSIGKQIGEGDGTLGYDVFEDKIIEFNYDKKLMIIHDSSFKIDKGYVKFSMQLQGGEVPFLPGTLINNDKKYKADFMFDMGATGCLFLNQGFLFKNKLYGAFKITGESQMTGAGAQAIKTTRVLLPGFVFGNYELKQVPIYLESPAEHDPGTGVLGMDLLKRFNTIIDYQNNMIYLKPNGIIKSPYK
ncbi:aspartyl protease family protein [Mucilaginibacter sp. BJC16-A38]|uniref:aspartyl protease family protein n=1 Tax=Mucilaginibacter phenanthrenivorans TaxID=1234842 RepID=UPI002158846E|nr:aspartyl protease family protein [Mucilaginibacter phenanthrenivorans]MCR8559396.1 aspartyl protease family protein [Mucilaginibacter phenanthrenivorans]